MKISNVTAQPRQVRFIGQTGTTVLTPEARAAVREEDLAEAQDDARYQAALSEGWPVSSFAPSVNSSASRGFGSGSSRDPPQPSMHSHGYLATGRFPMLQSRSRRSR